MEKKNILELSNLCKSFLRDDGKSTLILDDINLKIKEKEIIGVLGRSGSGKSTLLRIISGLIPADKGNLTFKKEHFNQPLKEITMVFQNFSLFPWLTVMENVIIGLEAKGNLSMKLMEEKANNVLDIMGLRNYENAYPRELSGGMKQRVGFARALVMNPSILLLDEAFSSLDILTARKMQADILDLWVENKLSPEAILMVTHSIEESVLLTDRVLILSSNPGKIVAEIEIDLDHPRDRFDPAFRKLVDKIYFILNSNFKKVLEGKGDELSSPFAIDNLPKCGVNQMISFMLILKSHSTGLSVSELAQKLNLDIDNLLFVMDSAVLNRFVDIDNEMVSLSSSGKIFVEADTLLRKKIFKEHIVQYIPFISQLRLGLKEKENEPICCDDFITQLQTHLGEELGKRAFSFVIDWSRYANLFIYKANTRTIKLVIPANAKA